MKRRRAQQDWPRQALIGALAGLPLLGLELWLAGSIANLGTTTADSAAVFVLLLLLTILGTSAAALAYERLAGYHWSPHIATERRLFRWFVVGPAVAAITFFAGFPILLAIVFGLLANAIALPFLGRHAVWDTVVAAIGVAGWYTIIHAVLGLSTSGDIEQLMIGTEPLGLTLRSLPIEQYLAAAGIGMLVGPLFAATKYFRHTGAHRPAHVTPGKAAIVVAPLLLCTLLLGAVVYLYDSAPAVRLERPVAGAQSVSVTSALVLAFSRPVDRDSVQVTLTPEVEGAVRFDQPSLSYHGFRRATYETLTTLQPDTEYTLTVSGARAVWGGTGRTATFSFVTAPVPDILKVSGDSDPVQGANGTSTLRLRDTCAALTVDLTGPNDGGAEFVFRTEPEVVLTPALQPDHRSYVLRPATCWPEGALRLIAERRTVIRDRVTDEVIAAGEFLPVLDTAVAIGTTTAAATERVLAAIGGPETLTPVRRQKILRIAMDFQDKPLSCEAAALKMALAGRGVRVTETQIMRRVGYDPTPHRNGVWGDPDKAFVGNIAGRQNTTGYGVHWDPIARAAKSWRNATVLRRASVTNLTRHIDAGRPVVIWGTQGRAYRDYWKTKTGKVVRAWKGEHARTLIGYYGAASSPTHFVINDPIVGRIVWTRQTFETNWARFQNSGVAVY